MNVFLQPREFIYNFYAARNPFGRGESFALRCAHRSDGVGPRWRLELIRQYTAGDFGDDEDEDKDDTATDSVAPQAGAAGAREPRPGRDIVTAWSINRLGRSLQHVVSFLNELNAVNVDQYLHQQSVDSSTPGGKAMLSMCECS